MTVSAVDVRADVLAKLLLIQSTASQLRDEAAILAFICRGLLQVPGVAEAHYAEPGGDVGSDAAARDGKSFPIRLRRKEYGQIQLRLSDADRFSSYGPHISNLVFMVAVMIEERHQRQLAEERRRELESRVEERTRLLSNEVRERRAAEAVALTEKGRAECYLDIAEAVIVELDTQGRVKLINKRGCDLLQISPQDAVGRDWLELAIPPDARAACRAVLEVARQASVPLPCRRECPLVTRAGERRYLAWHYAPQFTQGQMTGSIISGMDITERKQQELEREDLLRREQAARAEAQEANVAKDKFLAVISHELRNPLTPILAGTHLLRHTLPDGHRGHRALAVIDRNVHLQARFIDDLLDLSRIQRGTLTVGQEPVSLSDVVATAVDAAHPDFEHAGLRLVTDLVEQRVLGDADRLHQIVINLLSNAAKFTPAGGEVRVRLEQAGEFARIIVEDSGMGIDPALLPHVFEMFRQGETEGRRNPGLGIGLALVKSLAESQRGRVSVESAGPGKGSRFVVELPSLSTPSGPSRDDTLERKIGVTRRGQPGRARDSPGSSWDDGLHRDSHGHRRGRAGRAPSHQARRHCGRHRPARDERLRVLALCPRAAGRLPTRIRRHRLRPSRGLPPLTRGRLRRPFREAC